MKIEMKTCSGKSALIFLYLELVHIMLQCRYLPSGQCQIMITYTYWQQIRGKEEEQNYVEGFSMECKDF